MGWFSKGKTTRLFRMGTPAKTTSSAFDSLVKKLNHEEHESIQKAIDKVSDTIREINGLVSPNQTNIDRAVRACNELNQLLSPIVKRLF